MTSAGVTAVDGVRPLAALSWFTNASVVALPWFASAMMYCASLYDAIRMLAPGVIAWPPGRAVLGGTYPPYEMGLLATKKLFAFIPRTRVGVCGMRGSVIVSNFVLMT